VPPISAAKYVPLFVKAQEQWASFGFTSAQEDLLGGGAGDDWDAADAGSGSDDDSW
jgi:hypothetical protein